jgi:hypothetical protein
MESQNSSFLHIRTHFDGTMLSMCNGCRRLSVGVLMDSHESELIASILALSHKAEDAIKGITAFYKAKDVSIKPLEIYLSENMSTIQLLDGLEGCTASPKGEGNVLKSNVQNLFSHRI